MGVHLRRLAFALLLAQLACFCAKSDPELDEQLQVDESILQLAASSRGCRLGFGSCFPWSSSGSEKPFRVYTCKSLKLDMLPTRIKPKHYDLSFRVDIDKHKFDGKAQIDVLVGKDESRKPHSILNSLIELGKSDEIILHVDEHLTIEGVEVSLKSPQRKLAVARVCRKNSMIKIELNEKLADNSAVRIDISFASEIKKQQSNGLYETRQVRRDGRLSNIVDTLTQFEPMYARHVFPCFDEPKFKATFRVRILHASHLTALSNTEVFRQEPDYEPGFTLTEFAQTPPVSSYLVAFSVGSYDHIESSINDGKLLVRVFVEKGQASKAQVGLEATGKSLSFLEQYTSIPYPLSKVDLLAADNYDMGAMENWGLVTFKNDMLYYDPVYTSQWRETIVVKTVAHEIAHQWFGNLVTLNWWSELWLNEAFAEFFAYKTSQAIRPDLDYDHFFLKSCLTPAFAEDSDHDAEPMQREGLISLDQVLSNFSGITYNKGASILRMLESLLGPEQWQKIIQKYLKAHQYSNVKPVDFIDAVQHLDTLVPIEEFFRSWFKQPGFPLVSVNLDAYGRRLIFVQAQFTYDNIRDHAGRIWFLPITVIFGDQSGKREVKRMQTSERKSSLDLPEWFKPSDQNHWVKVNEDFKGFYYVQYAPDLYQRLQVALAVESALSAADKYNLVSEMTALATGGQETLDNLLQVVEWTVKGDENLHGIVWSAILAATKKLVAMASGQAEIEALRIAHRYLSLVLKRFGFRSAVLNGSPSPSDNLARPEVLNYLVLTRHQDAIAEALKVFEEADGKPMDPNVAPTVYLAVASHGSDAQFQQLHRLLLSAQDPENRLMIAHALASVYEDDRLDESFKWIVELDKDDKLHILDTMLASSKGKDFLKRKIILCQSSSCPFSPSHLETLVESICIVEKQTVEQAFKHHPFLPHWLQSVKQTVDMRLAEE